MGVLGNKNDKNRKKRGKVYKVFLISCQYVFEKKSPFLIILFTICFSSDIIFSIMKEVLLAPSLLSADFSDLASAFKMIESCGGSVVHIDVMDGQFVPQISYGQPVIKSVRKLTSLPFDVHLMIENPDLAVDSFIDAGADWITFHYEASTHIDRLVNHIHEKGKKCGISIVPSTPVESISETLPLVDLVLVMTVNPGFGGQKLIPYCVEKIKKLKKIREERNLNFKISVDGGVNEKNVSDVVSAGSDIVVSGSAFFSGKLKWEL